MPWYVAIREGKYKYVRYLRPGEIEEVYDLAADPEELTNLAVKQDHAELLARLRKVAIEELRRTQAGFADEMPPTK